MRIEIRSLSVLFLFLRRCRRIVFLEDLEGGGVMTQKRRKYQCIDVLLFVIDV